MISSMATKRDWYDRPPSEEEKREAWKILWKAVLPMVVQLPGLFLLLVVTVQYMNTDVFVRIVFFLSLVLSMILIDFSCMLILYFLYLLPTRLPHKDQYFHLIYTSAALFYAYPALPTFALMNGILVASELPVWISCAYFALNVVPAYFYETPNIPVLLAPFRQ